MPVYDSSVLIDYLDGGEEAVSYVESHLDERAVSPSLVLFEVYQGEVYKSGPPDFDAVDSALGWLTIVEESRTFAQAAAELQVELARRGDPLSARDAFVAGTAVHLDERLVVADADFDVDGLTDVVEVDIL